MSINCKVLLFVLLLGITTLNSYSVEDQAASPLRAAISNLTDFKTGRRIDLKDTKIIVFVGYLGGCPILKRYRPLLSTIQKKFSNEILIFYFDPTYFYKKNKQQYLKEFDDINSSFPLIVNRELNKTLNIRVASEVVVYGVKRDAIVYQGAINDKINYDQVRVNQTNKNNYLVDAITSELKNKRVKITKTKPIGCFLNLDEEN